MFIFLLFPIYWMIVSSFKENNVLFKLPPEFLPTNPTLVNYKSIFVDNIFVTYYKNSLSVSFGATVLTMFVATFCGYAFSRFKYRLNEVIITLILSASMFPVVSQLISIYAIFKNNGLLNNHYSLMMIITSVSLPFCILMIRSYFNDIPKELDEAAKIDGCGRMRTMFQIILPLVKPGLLAVGIYTFMRAWDDYQYGLTLINRDELRTLGPGISLRFLGDVQFDWGKTLSVAVAASIPVLFIFMFLQKYMVSGLTAGAVKG
ncbi:MAG: carbohydrate ABC transporter permease [Clostridiaceae bacterium]|nr:carbohydrate ABC transporter permease [Clostridiaceae bacterium]